MAKRKKPARGDAETPRTAGPAPLLRPGGHRLTVFNSGLEVWLYDEANLQRIRSGNRAGLPSGMPDRFAELTHEGLIVGYSLLQDDGLDVECHVGAPLTAAELVNGRWLEPQTAFLRLPSGRLCLESNDASRVGNAEPTETGAVAAVPPGDYRLTLLRADYEALSREGIEWHGPQEVIVLTPGGTAGDAAQDLLPFEQRRDLSWVGRYAVRGRRAEALVWFPDYWDTFILNLDAAAVRQLGLGPGHYLRTEVAAPPISLISVYAASWNDAQRLPPPAGVPLDEYGLAALSPMQEWNGAEALFCRRERTRTQIEDQHHNLWLPAVVEVLNAVPAASGGRRQLAASDLAAKQYFDDDFLGFVWSEVLPEAEEAGELPLAKALPLLGRHLKKLKLVSLGDWDWTELSDGRQVETCCRLYSGPGTTSVLVFAREGMCEVLFLSDHGDGRWTVTGLADDFQRLASLARARGADNAGLVIDSRDEPIAEIAAAHREALEGADAPALAAPGDADGPDGGAFLERFLEAAFGPPAAA